jgi:competence protein ComEA
MLKKILALAAAFYAVASFAAVDVNKATAADLDGIRGVGPGLSTRILDERKKGSFKDWDDFISRIRGIGDTNAPKFSAAGLTVNGESFKGVAAAPAPRASKKDLKTKAPGAPAASAEGESAGTGKPTAEEAKAIREERKAARAEARKRRFEESKAMHDADKPKAMAQPQAANAMGANSKN